VSKITLSAIALILYGAVAMPARAQKKSSFTDSRDGKKYKTVVIGDQTWVAEDLNIATKEGSWCYGDKDPCTHRLYNWKAATESCPAGWHLPSEAEWLQLIATGGGDSVAAQRLKASKGWKASDAAPTNATGFSALPGGYRNHGAVFGGQDTEGYWWSTTELGGGAWYFSMRYDSPMVKKYGSNHKGGGFSVRCIKD
jgi:uncharacterized protein (TIGR02145 family)